MAYRKLVKPSIIGEWMSASKYLPILIAIPAVFFLILWAISNGLTIPDGEIVYGKVFYGDYYIDPPFTLLALFVAFTFFRGGGHPVEVL